MLGSGGRPARLRDERHASLGPVECARCGAAVLAAKFSPQHTSIQWSAAAVRACAEFGALAAARGRPSEPEGRGAGWTEERGTSEKEGGT